MHDARHFRRGLIWITQQPLPCLTPPPSTASAVEGRRLEVLGPIQPEDGRRERRWTSAEARRRVESRGSCTGRASASFASTSGGTCSFIGRTFLAGCST